MIDSRLCLFSCNVKPLFKRYNAFHHVVRDKIPQDILVFRQLFHGFLHLTLHFECGEGPGDEVLVVLKNTLGSLDSNAPL